MTIGRGQRNAKARNGLVYVVPLLQEIYLLTCVYSGTGVSFRSFVTKMNVVSGPQHTVLSRLSYHVMQGMPVLTFCLFTVQYNVWCMNNGNYHTFKLGSVNWNKDLIWKMRTELEYQWDLLEETIQTSFEELLGSVKDQFRKVESLLESMLIGMILKLIYGHL